MSKPDTSLPSRRQLQSIPLNFDNPAFEADSNYHAVEIKSGIGGQLDVDKAYDPHDYCSVEHPTSFWGTVFHTIILMAGPGVLSIPILFVEAGYLTSTILMPCLFYLYMHNAKMLVWSEYQLCRILKKPTLPYPEVVHDTFKEGPKFSQWFSKWSRRLTYLVFFIVWYSYYCYNYVIVCQNLQVLWRNMFHEEISVNIFLEIFIVPMLILGCIPKLKYLVPISFLGTICHGLSLILIMYFIFTDPSPWSTPPMIGHWSNIPILMGSVLLSVNISGILIKLKNEMQEPRRFTSTWFSVITVSFVPTSFLYAGFCLICALKYGKSIQPSVIQNLPQNDFFAQIGIALSSIAIICQQPFGLIVSYDVIWNLINGKVQHSKHSMVWEYILKVVLVFLAFIISIALPNIFLFISLGGSVGTSIDSLILPAAVCTIMKWKIFGNEGKFWFIFSKNFIIILLAIVLAIFGCSDCINQIMEYYFNQS
ncbi:hypothetical protein V9T40_012993 [Parthenolecanium corni]|uniref:Amino acid transporter transmembrane domain-containing protein n=1 Tax=Parthenolecanium corni TaxID=536013 RepID=A0AAN9XZV4_9HEMI